MGVKEYFFDSYALIEVIKGNPAYLKYSDEIVTITIFNLVEVTYAVFRSFGEEKAHEVYEKFKGCVQDMDWGVILAALKLKDKYNKKHLSYADCLGYAFAESRDLFFLTGDEDFRDMNRVEFVK
ncbi:PIN domain-containing protein [Candidatus Woesearchaeota archaeon]|nr:PIN domain-containing protein [Candidatus Woesearchaeota archaeon]